MTYDAWRVSFQSSEQAARAAYAECERLRAALREIQRQEWRHGTDFCHPEGCESPGIARRALPPNVEIRGSGETTPDQRNAAVPLSHAS